MIENREVDFITDEKPENSVMIVTNNCKAYIPLGDLVDFEAERTRLNKELKSAQEDLEFVNKKLNNAGFMAKAPENVVKEILPILFPTGKYKEILHYYGKVKCFSEYLICIMCR